MLSHHQRTFVRTIGRSTILIFGILLLALVQAAPADQRGSAMREFRDTRYSHDRSYPGRGQIVRTLPRDRRFVVHGHQRYYFHSGVWYRPQGPRFVIVAPPVGLIVPWLPPHYVTVRVGRMDYYYANDVYYVPRGNAYAVVAPPQDDIRPASPPAPAEQTFVYPRLGQNEQQQADDRYACHRWAVDQTGFDPTQPSGDTSEIQRNGKHEDYQRAMGACLDGRGYTVK